MLGFSLIFLGRRVPDVECQGTPIQEFLGTVEDAQTFVKM